MTVYTVYVHIHRKGGKDRGMEKEERREEHNRKCSELPSEINGIPMLVYKHTLIWPREGPPKTWRKCVQCENETCSLKLRKHVQENVSVVDQIYF